MDISVSALWHCWQRFVQGKKCTEELDEFRYYLERNLRSLQIELQDGTYRHGGYRTFSVHDPKQREIAVASVKDRFVHRLLYEYLVEIYDKTFIDDVWSCRKGKGLLGAIERAQALLGKHRNGYFWRADIHKFFDSVDQGTFVSLLEHKVHDPHAMRLLREVMGSYAMKPRYGNERERVLSNVAASLLAMLPAKCFPISI